jgi:Acetyltransferase (GNAT) domain
MLSMELEMVTGHAHPSYAEALAEFGRPRELPRCGGWVLERHIPGSSDRDAMGCYPLFSCRNWAGLKADVDELSGDLVSLSMVPDPYGDYELTDLNGAFDHVSLFKEHVVVDLQGSWEVQVDKHHRYMCRRALRHMEIRRCASPQDYLEDWVRVYGQLVAKHGIRDMRAFSHRSLSMQLDVPGASLFVAIHKQQVIGALLVYQQANVAYAQLTGVDPVGYKQGASYALFWTAMQYYADKVRWFNLSGVPGVSDTGREGLRWFKQGWSRETRAVYFCGRVFNRTAYDTLVRIRGDVVGGYFPAYRAGEFA